MLVARASERSAVLRYEVGMSFPRKQLRRILVSSTAAVAVVEVEVSPEEGVGLLTSDEVLFRHILKCGSPKWLSMPLATFMRRP